MNDLNTFEDCTEVYDPLYRSQKEGVSRMRASLLSCSDGSITTQALHNITVLRISHQIGRIIRYLDMMDKLEATLYSSVDELLTDVGRSDYSYEPGNRLAAINQMLTIQERIQDIMIKSDKLLEPYLSLQDFNIVEADTASPATPVGQLLNSSDRDRLRLKAQAVLTELDEHGSE